ncbi:MAG: DUF3352 domain-containing protein, partial [Anaerolineales bacterium]
MRVTHRHRTDGRCGPPARAGTQAAGDLPRRRNTMDTQLETAMESGGKSKAPWVIGAVVAAILGCGCVCVVAVALLILFTDVLSFLPFFGSHDVAEILPADTPFVTTFSLDFRDGPGWAHLADVYGEPLERDPSEESWLDEIEEEWGISFEEDIRPWLGSELAIALPEIDEDIFDYYYSETPPVVMAARTTNRSASSDFLAKMRSNSEDEGYVVTETTYLDVTYYVQLA